MRNLPTERQLALINALLRERVTDRGADDLSMLTLQGASDLIAELFRAPKRERANAPQRVSEPGMYRADNGTIYKVQLSSSGRLYAKALNASGRGFTYAQGAIYTLTPAHRMTLAEAQAFGVATGNCCVCGRELTDPQSVAQGIGPVCASRWF